MLFTRFALPLDQLPPPVENLISYALLLDVEGADIYLATACCLLLALVFIQLKSFARPPPVPLKRLPNRPAVTIVFKPDDVTSARLLAHQQQQQQQQNSSERVAADTEVSQWKTRLRSSLSSASVGKVFTQSIFRGASSAVRLQKTHTTADTELSAIDERNGAGDMPTRVGLSEGLYNVQVPSAVAASMAGRVDPFTVTTDTVISDDEFGETISDDGPTKHPARSGTGHPAEPSMFHPNMDLPDSFAPLLSSSQVEVFREQLTADLIHAIHVEGGVRFREGRHEVPLDKDNSRPQLVLDIPKGGCRLSALGVIGSDGFSATEDFDVLKKTVLRSKPLVKHAGIVLDPPLPLSNVAPTLIHFPTLFEDNFVPTLRRIQIVRHAMDFIISISSFLEKCLWIVESKCQVHLSKVRIMPIYKGHDEKASTEEDKSPEWRLSLAFSGHVLLFGWIPIPFISVTLPTVIIPQPHALLDYLLTAQPLASAKLKRENIAEERIAIALLNTVDSWNAELKLLATPPAAIVDVTLPGGVSLAVEAALGRDPQAGRHRTEADPAYQVPVSPPQSMTGDTASVQSWSTPIENNPSTRRRSLLSSVVGTTASTPPFDANQQVPWCVEIKLKGSISHDKLSLHILKLSVTNEEETANGQLTTKSQFATRGSLAVWKVRPPQRQYASDKPMDDADLAPLPLRKRTSFGPSNNNSNNNNPHSANSSTGSHPNNHARANSYPHKRVNSYGHHPELTEDSPSVGAILLFPDKTDAFHKDLRVLQYDYAFDVFEDTKLDAVTMSVGATHPMLNGGTMVTVILDSIFAFGSMSAREDAVLDPHERKRKRNVLRHLPAIDFTFGIQHVFIPPESSSFSDDGQTLFLPEVDGGRMVIRMLGGIDDSDNRSTGSHVTPIEPVLEGIKMVVDFEVASLALKTEGAVKEFPELDIFEGVKLRSNMNGIITGGFKIHLRPQQVNPHVSTAGPNILNPLEAYEIDFSGSSLSVKMKEYSSSLGHRRVIFPTESTFFIKVVESVVDMGFDGKTQCELSWDFQGLSPILQVTKPGASPEDAVPENKQQVSLLIPPLRQGRFSFHVSSVGGVRITKAATMREDKEGLYDWKFFNAILSTDSESPGRILDVLHDKRTMEKLLQVIRLVNEDLHKMLRYALQQVWRAKDILDQEGVSDPAHVIPMYKMARLILLFLSGDMNEFDTILSIVRRVIDGEGLDVVAVKELLRKHVEHYDSWAPEIDRAVRWAAVMLGPMAATQPYVEDRVLPLAEFPNHAVKFRNIPSASELYQQLLEKPHLPLDPAFSNMVSRVAPYLSFRQISYILQVRSPCDWQSADLRRIRYVYSIKRKVLDIAESYGGLSFLPQSFMVSVFLGEATRTSLRAANSDRYSKKSVSAASTTMGSSKSSKMPTLSRLRRRRKVAARGRLQEVVEVPEPIDFGLSPAQRVASYNKFSDKEFGPIPSKLTINVDGGSGADTITDEFELGDSLLGPQDVAILLQAGLTSVMKSSTVVQLNQRMLLDLMCSQPRSFSVGVLAEIGTPGGQGSPRGLTSALMALLELDQNSFKASHQIDMHLLLESWLPGLKIPRREDYMAGGRWARQSYYEALFSVSTSILSDAESYMALKGHLQRVRRHGEDDPIPRPREDVMAESTSEQDLDAILEGKTINRRGSSKLAVAIQHAKDSIKEADDLGHAVVQMLLDNEDSAKQNPDFERSVSLYREAFGACARVLSLDKHSFHSDWFRSFYKRNYDALMIKSMYDNVVEDVDDVRHWLLALQKGSKASSNGATHNTDAGPSHPDRSFVSAGGENHSAGLDMLGVSVNSASGEDCWEDMAFLEPERTRQQLIIDSIIDATIFDENDRDTLRRDPLVRLLIDNPPGNYEFTIVSAMGVITEGKKGLELKDAFARLKEKRGVDVVRADTGTARSFEFNASKIEEAIEVASTKLGKPYGLLGYSQGCANALMAESMLLSGSPKQQRTLTKPNAGLVCRQLLFSACNGSFHGPAMEAKVQRLIVMCEEFFKYQQGYFSRALSTTVLETLNNILDSADFHKLMGGAQSFLRDGCRAFWREAQHLSSVPTCTIRGVMEKHTTPEALEMISHLLTKQSGSALHDSQVHVFDAVGYPVYHLNRNGRVLKQCAVGEGAIQRTHHWSPLSDEVEFLQTSKDLEIASFECAKDRHVFPWVDVNARFGFIRYSGESENGHQTLDSMDSDEGGRIKQQEVHPKKLMGTEMLLPMLEDD